MLTLRPYQAEAIEAVYDHLRSRNDNPCVVIPTAGGKTPVMASIAKDAVVRWCGRVLILAHSQELLEQTADKLRAVCPDVKYGVYSAGLRRRDTDHPVIVAGIQSVYRRACELGAFDLVIVDEAHMIPAEGDGMYRQFLLDASTVNPRLRVIGMTATPFRLKSGTICTSDGVLNSVCYEVGVAELIRDGYLCPLVTKNARTSADTSKLGTRAGEFVADQAQELMDQDALVEAACAEIAEHTAERRATLIFASGIKHGRHIVDVMGRNHGSEVGFVCGETSRTEREQTLRRFAAGEIAYLCNVNVLTTGFDAPHIDCVALVRPTMSPGLYYQMCGRGFRLHPDKQNCLVLDFGGNVLRHGPVDQLRITPPSGTGVGTAPVKECKACQAVVAAGCANCPECGHPFPPPDRQQHEAQATSASVLATSFVDVVHEVLDVSYHVHTKRGATSDSPKSMRVDYRLGLDHWQSEWVCLEHSGYARQRAIEWWQRRSPGPVPDTVAEAVEIAQRGGLAFTESITVRSVEGERFDRIVGHRLAAVDALTTSPQQEPNEPEVPF